MHVFFGSCAQRAEKILAENKVPLERMAFWEALSVISVNPAPPCPGTPTFTRLPINPISTAQWRRWCSSGWRGTLSRECGVGGVACTAREAAARTKRPGMLLRAAGRSLRKTVRIHPPSLDFRLRAKAV